MRFRSRHQCKIMCQGRCSCRDKLMQLSRPEPKTGYASTMPPISNSAGSSTVCSIDERDLCSAPATPDGKRRCQSSSARCLHDWVNSPPHYRPDADLIGLQNQTSIYSYSLLCSLSVTFSRFCRQPGWLNSQRRMRRCRLVHLSWYSLIHVTPSVT